MSNISIKNREIRVFLSSTFRDMEAERNHLIKQVFPVIRSACMARQVGFTEIDLRWGITEEEAKNGNTVEICLSEIDRCRDFPPFFIGFLGERYGWIPKPEELNVYWAQRNDSQYRTVIQEAVQKGISVTELEMELAILGEGAVDKISGRALFLLRDRTLTDALYQRETNIETDYTDTRFYDNPNGLLDRLKNRIRSTPFLGIDGYGSIEQFGEAITAFLLNQLDTFFPESQIPTELERAKESHLRFRYHRLQNFIPRSDIRDELLNAMQERIEQPYLGPILLAGPSGQGKSAIMADLAHTLELSQEPVHWRVIDHYVGADDRGSLDSWIMRLLETLHPEIEDLTGPIPQIRKDQYQVLSSWLAMAARRNEQQQDDGIPVRFALLLDATDQFFDGGKDLDQLTPEVLGNYGIVLVSAADGTVAIKAAKKFTTIDVPAFTPALKAQLIQNILYRYRKTLPAELAYILASAPQADSPLFLSLALEELRVDARHENLSAKIEAILQSPDAAHLFLQRFLLDEDYGRTENPALAAHFMALLGASRSGLSENELSELLALPTDPIPERTGQPKLPQIYLSRLLTAFQPFLLNKQGCHAPMHRLLGVAAQDELSNEVLRKKIYKYFKSKCLKDNLSINQRYASETIYQLIRLTEENSDNKKILKKRIKSYLSEVVTVLQLEDHYLLLEALKILDEHDFRFIQRKWKKFIFFKSRSDMDQSIIDSMRGYGTWLSSHGIFRPAIKILTFLEEWQIIHNKERDDVSSTTNSLANIYVTVGEFNRAKFLYEKNLEMDISIFGEDSEVAATGYNNLGLLLSDIGNYNESKALLIKALSIRKRILGNNHRYTASTLNNMACLLSQMKNTDEAIEYQNQALIIQNTILDSIHEDIADSHSNLGFLMMRKGDYYLSEMHFRLANSIDEKRVGREHYLTGISLGGLGRVLYKSNRIKESCSTLNGAYLIHTKTLGLAHSFTKISLSNYIDALLADNNLEEVISTYDRAMNSISTTDMDTRIDIIKIFANAYFGFEAFHKKAKSLYEDALRLEEKNKGHYHKDTLETLQSLAVLLRDIGELESAEILLSELIVKITAIHRKDSLEIASALSAKGVLLKLKQDIDGAKDCFNQALKIRQKMLGSEHELSQLVRQRLIDLE